MPYTIKTGAFKYKNGNQFTEIDCIKGQDLSPEVEDLQKNRAPIILDSASGNPIVLTDGAEGLSVENLKISFGPVQSDDPSPSNICPISGRTGITVYRAGKNLFDEIYPDIDTSVRYKAVYVGNSKVTVSTSCPWGGESSACLFALAGNVDSGASTDGNGLAPDVSRTITPINGYITIGYRIAYSVDPRDYDTQIEVGETPSPYAEYTGESYSVTFPTTGKNLCPPLVIGNGINSTTGSDFPNATGASSGFIPVSFANSNKYKLSGLVNTLQSWVAAYNSEKVFLGRMAGEYRTSAVITDSMFTSGTPQGTGEIAFLRVYQYVAIGSSVSIDVIENAQIQLEHGEITTSYEPYTNTVYGGALDAMNGVLKVEWAFANLNSESTWGDYGTDDGYLVYTVKPDMQGGNRLSGCCDMFPSTYSATDANIRFGAEGDNVIRIYRISTLGITSLSEWKEYIGTNGINICYPLANPIEVPISSLSIQTLLGNNNIWTDADNVDLIYRADTKLFVDKNVPDVQINGTSILSDGVANIPLVKPGTPGVLGGVAGGIYMSPTAGTIQTNMATASQLKAGTNTNNVVVPSNQHTSVFYALSKLAGVDLASGNDVVGVYPNNALVAIQKMLGIYKAPWEVIRQDSVNNETESDVTILVDNNGSPFELTDVWLKVTLPRNKTCAIGYYGVINAYYSDNLNTSFELGAQSSQQLTYDRYGTGIIIQDNNFLMSGFSKYTSSGTASSIAIQGPYSGIILAQPRTYFKFVIKNVTGEIEYTLYGKRKWTT